MKVKALKKFTDLKANVVRDKGSTFETTEKRLKELNSTSWGVMAEEVDEKAKEETKKNG